MKSSIAFFALLVSSLSFANTPCASVGRAYQNKLSVPYETFRDADVKRCVQGESVSAESLPLFIASAFYYSNLETRKAAISKLEQYTCEDRNVCEKFYGYLDSHLKATRLAGKGALRELRARTDALRARTQSRFAELSMER